MNINRRNFLGAGAVAAASTLVGGKASAGSTVAATKRRRFVGSCPGVINTIGRRPGPTRIMVIGAHPDDADIICGCFSLKLIEKGYKVKFVSITDGRMGHQRLTPDETARTRRAETLEAAKRFGLDGYDIYGAPDCGLIPTYEWRCRVAAEIRKYEPDYIITHRTCDYHADHRATGTLVMDAGYLLGVPHWVPEAPAQRRRPVIFYMSDAFTVPKEMRADVLIDAGPYLDRWCEGLDAQVSQFYDWLPWDMGREDEVRALGDRKDIPRRNAYLKKYWSGRKRRDAVRYADAWREQYPGKPVPEFVEAYEVSEYGRAPNDEDFRILIGE
ncbi:MAG: PIG-L family deacetylase [Kiritimatiellae bacterium]|nr:PIG-L family deacetylase [Kiritimatiellia bacterium]